MYAICSTFFPGLGYPKEHARYQMWRNLNSIYVLKPLHPEWWAQYEVSVDSVKGLMVDSDDKVDDKGSYGIWQFVAGWTETK